MSAGVLTFVSHVTCRAKMDAIELACLSDFDNLGSLSAYDSIDEDSFEWFLLQEFREFITRPKLRAYMHGHYIKAYRQQWVELGGIVA